MAEAPECAIFADFLDSFRGSTLVAADAKKKYDVGEFVGQKLSSVLSVGRSIIFTFEGDAETEIESIVGKRGSWTSAVENGKYDIKFLFRSETEDKLAFFCTSDETDAQWRKVTSKYVSGLAPCVLRDADDITFDYVKIKARQRPSMTVSRFLMEENVFSGIGKYLKSDIIFSTKVNPHLRMSEFTDEQLLLLTKNITFVAKLSYKAGGCESATKCTMPFRDGMYIPFIYGRSKYTAENGLEYNVIKEQIGGCATYWIDWDDVANDDEEMEGQ